MKTCPFCSAENVSQARFCRQCGHTLAPQVPRSANDAFAAAENRRMWQGGTSCSAAGPEAPQAPSASLTPQAPALFLRSPALRHFRYGVAWAVAGGLLVLLCAAALLLN